MTNLKIMSWNKKSTLKKKIKCVFNKILGLIVRAGWEVSAGGHLTSALVPILSYVCSLKWYAMIGRASSAVRCHVQPILCLLCLRRGSDTWWSLSGSDIKKTGALCKFSAMLNQARAAAAAVILPLAFQGQHEFHHVVDARSHTGRDRQIRAVLTALLDGLYQALTTSKRESFIQILDD